MDENINGGLLVIGNGFDLNCGLKSSFESFLKTVNCHNNLWYLVFSFAFPDSPDQYPNPIFDSIKSGEILWMDVEDYIKRVLYMHQDKKPKINQLFETFGKSDYCSVLNLCYEHRFDRSYLHNNVQFCEFKNYFSTRFSFDYQCFDIIDHLKTELISFEDDFKSFISAISNDESYREKTAKLLNLLIGKEEACDILTFNYTTPDLAAVNLVAYGNINHVHGSINENIIIGFDSSDILNFKDNKIQLSKSFKKLFYRTENNPLPSKDQVNFLKFYGHSLGNQDYSYFHTLFDFYDIYNNGKVVLIFYYTPYADNDKGNEAIREDFINRVYKLLNDYSLKAMIGNEKNNIIINKLLLENRLFIQEIEVLS